MALAASEKRVTCLGTGAVWKSADCAETGRFLCNYSEWRREGEREAQNILFARSDDLIHWHPLGDAHRFSVNPRWVERARDLPGL